MYVCIHSYFVCVCVFVCVYTSLYVCIHSFLEKETATHSNILAWGIAWTAEPGEPQSMGLQRVRHDLATKQQQHTFFVCICCDNTAFVSEVKDISKFPL